MVNKISKKNKLVSFNESALNDKNYTTTIIAGSVFMMLIQLMLYLMFITLSNILNMFLIVDNITEGFVEVSSMLYKALILFASIIPIFIINIITSALSYDSVSISFLMNYNIITDPIIVILITGIASVIFMLQMYIPMKIKSR